jgi:hypothetical protein
MGEAQKVGPELIKSILREAGEHLTTRQLQQKVLEQVPFCVSSNVVALNIMRLTGVIKGKRTEEGAWVWWVEDRGSK